jgi:hypothetical protein
MEFAARLADFMVRIMKVAEHGGLEPSGDTISGAAGW